MCLELKEKYKIDVVPMLISNGVLLSKKMVKFLQDNLVLFGVSLDGTKDIHNLNRKDCFGNGTYDLISNNLLNIENNEFVGVSMTITPSFNGDIVECYQDMFKHAPTIAIRFKRNINIDDDSFYRASYCIINGYRRLKDLLIDNLNDKKYDLFFAILNGDDAFAKIFIRVFTGFRVDRPCEGMLGRFTFQNNKVYPCAPSSDLRLFECDNIFENNLFDEIVRNSKKHCKDCFARYYCGGECPIVYHQRNTIDQGLCDIKKCLVELSINLICHIVNNNNVYVKIREFIYNKMIRDLK